MNVLKAETSNSSNATPVQIPKIHRVGVKKKHSKLNTGVTSKPAIKTRDTTWRAAVLCPLPLSTTDAALRVGLREASTDHSRAPPASRAHQRLVGHTST
ncbi:hypothetical protein E2C01_075067 [Portunus trituberculatus]|uniref:Uncharacterized protein n=1 Tax=Portunus trituberculatus TaxID=210409 RepID=A0A5B7IFX8_PORTR|nr:hypothetical protein [Portunus trituberculatus]